ncbi:uncharacterized protein JCM6883_002733 [Sporobolomyces salmoneus]|uniref:uncharacterized protein n=1 Tax=Sporobolomyces salmoneus TaxID=183962 RepID=UPI00317F3252
MSRPASRTSSPTRPTPTSSGMNPSSSSSQQQQHQASSSSSRSSSPPPSTLSPSSTPLPSEPTPNTSTTSASTSSGNGNGIGGGGSVYPSSTSYPAPYWLRSPSSNPDPTYSNAPVLSEYLEANFVPSVVPQPEEYQAKEQARQYLEKLVQQISPGAKLLPFGSMANGFALKNSDMDLCCFLGKDAPVRAPSELVEQLGTLIERETNFYVKMLPRARIPIIKLNMPATRTIPEGMACDIGFENRLALENTRLLLTYAMVDPRLRTLVLFLKVWTKRRKINNPYRGTLSSYGYVLLVIHFLSHVKQPPVVPNLQRLPLPTTVPLEDLTYEGHDISFFDDLNNLPTVWQAQNVESTTGELLIDFFKYFANSFDYAKSVISIRSEKGTLGKEEKGWNSDIEFDPEMIVRDLHKLCIEDPFALDYNVARTVTKDGLYTIRGEFMRAVRILTTPSPRNSQTPADRVTSIMNELCAEREDFLLIHPAPSDHHHHHKPQYQQPQPQHSSHPASLQPTPLPISKSPRRRSAPSPQHPPPSAAHHPSPIQQQQQYGHVPIQGQPVVVSTGQTGWQQQTTMKGNSEELQAYENGNNLHPNAQLPQRRQHLQPSPYAARTNPSNAGQSYHSTAPSSVASSVAGDSQHDRRLSFDSSQERYPAAATPTSTSTSSGSGTNIVAPSSSSSTNGAYDLHRFFQNPPSSSMSDAGSVSPAPPLQPRTTVSLTAPSSPDLTPAYFTSHGAGGGGGGYHNQNSHYSGRTPYRYASSNYPSSSNSTSVARHASVPRNAHASSSSSHQPHSYSHLYASPSVAPAPAYPLNSSLSSSSSTTTPSSSSAGAYNPNSSPYPPNVSLASTSPLPAPIFPAEDRERIARASSITFGNFPELLPLPSYAHYHASGGSAAYLSGSGGWGVNPYGMGGTTGQQPVATGETRRGTGGARRSFGLTGEEDENVVEGIEGEENEDEGTSEFELDSNQYESTTTMMRGRMPPSFVSTTNGSTAHLYPTPLEHLSHVMVTPTTERAHRQRRRSVPQTRMGPDGRESILFGAIEVTLPKSEDVEAAQREEEEKEERAREEEGSTSVVESEQVSKELEKEEEEECEIANLGPSPSLEDQSQAPTTESIPEKAVETVQALPTLTTSPPTPAKPTPAPPVYACRPLSPLFNAIPVAPASPSPEDDDFDLDRTPRPASPSPLPEVSLNGGNVNSSSSASSASSNSGSPRILMNGLSMLSMSSNTDSTPSTPPRSKHAAKRARQNERKKVALKEDSTPPTLALTSNSLV